MPENWWAYVTRNSPGRSRADIGGLAGVDPSQVSRWKSGGMPRAENAIRFARSIGGDPIEALVVAGFLTPAEARAATVIRTGSGDLSVEELLAETRARLVRVTNTSSAEDEAAAGDETFIVNFDIANAPATAVEAFPGLQERVQLETILAAYGDSAGAIPAAAIHALTAGLGGLLDDVRRRSEADMYRFLRAYAAQIAARLDGDERPTRQ